MSETIEKLKKVFQETVAAEEQDIRRLATQMMLSLFSSVSDHIYVKNTPGVFLVSNNAHQKFLGGDPAGKTVYDFFPKALAHAYEVADADCLQANHPTITREYRPDRAFNVYEMTTVRIPLHDTNNDVCGILILCVNISLTSEEFAKNAFPIGVSPVQPISPPPHKEVSSESDPESAE